MNVIDRSDLIKKFEEAEFSRFTLSPLIEYYEGVVSRIHRLRDDFNVTIIGEVPLATSSLPVYRIASLNLQSRPHKILMTAGVHGNEAGGVEGALNFLESDTPMLNPDIGIVCYPCLNPRGYVLNSRWIGNTPHSRLDLNRNFTDDSNIEEIRNITYSFQGECKEFAASIDLHETMPDDGLIMALQYPERKYAPYEKTPKTFYMWEICHDHDRRIGSQVIQALKKHVPTCKWKKIFDDLNSGGVIFYPEGAFNTDYVAGPLDSYLYGKFSKHAFTTETYGNVSVEERGRIQQRVLNLIFDELSKKLTNGKA